MPIYYLIMLLALSSCATKYIVPGNRFITPESNGGAFKGQVEIQQAGANELAINIPVNQVEGVLYSVTPRTGSMYSNSFFDSFDIFWSHLASANSLLGAKLQLVGGSKASNSAGHKVAVTAALGANEHETEDAQVEFKLGGREFNLVYGYRISENFLPYVGLNKSTYDFEGEVVKGPYRGLRPKLRTDVLGFNAGLELTYGPVVAKLEGSYQQLKTDDTKDQTQTHFGWSLGYSW